MLLIGGAARVLGPVVGSIIFWFLITALGVFFAQATSGADPLIPASIMTNTQASLMRFIFLGLGLMLLDDLPTTRDLRRPKGAGPRCPLTPHPQSRHPTSLLASGRPATRWSAYRTGRGHPSPTPSSSPTTSPARFGGLTAVDVEHVEIQRGVITGLIGPDGAGKTTFFNLLTGFDRPDSGDWSFNGKSLKGVAAYKVARRGMVRTFQLTKVLSKLTVLENMRVGATGQKGESVFSALFAPLWRAQENANTVKADALLERFLLIKKREDFAGSLSGGQRKLLEMARALMAEPELVMLDEPMAGVNPALKQSLLGHVKALRDEGRSVLFVEHDMDMVRDISDWVIVMAQGKIVAEGPPTR